MRKSLSRTCQSLLHTCVSLPDAHSKKGFLFCARSYLIEALQAQALPLCHMSWMGSFLGPFYQSAGWRGSSGITLTVNQARIRLYDATLI